ncbi:MAG TPA: 50S ribosomal protein L3 [bacterium]|jgi:large subunit ribosomal protein L3|nr:50S ribosomal protein L3 [bacterium]
MAKFILGKKIGMTRIFTDKQSIPLTVVRALPNTILQLKAQRSDGYNAVQVGAGEIKEKNVKKPALGHMKKGGALHLVTKEFYAEENDNLKVGDKVNVTQFAKDDEVTITAVTKGKGYAGVMKRHGFHGGPKTHGSDHHRAPGSIGGAYPQRVFKGKKMPGHFGAVVASQKKTKVFDVDERENLILLTGSIPGANNSWISIKQ